MAKEDVNKYLAETRDLALEALEKEATTLASSRKIQSEEGRHLVNLITRLIEVQRHGGPVTPPISTHNG